MSLDPDPAEMRRLAHLAIERAIADRAALADARVITPPDPAVLRPLCAEPLPRAGHGVDSSLAKFFDELLPLATRVDHPRFFGYVPAPGSFVGALGDWLASVTNLFVGSWLGGASFAQLEVQVLDWLRDALGLEAAWGHGLLTSGGSMANLTALCVARERCAAPLERQTVHTSVEAHGSVRKAARILGYREENVIAVPVGFEQRIHPGALAESLDAADARGLVPAAVVATVGTTSTGAVDDVVACAGAAAEHGAWVHVDGAWGAAMAVLPERTEIRAALAAADSITLDPHKWLYTPLESGCLLTRHAGILEATFRAEGDYLQDVPRDEVNFFDRGPEMSRGARALKLWLLLRSVGVDRIADAIRHDCALAERARARLGQDPRITVVTEPRMSVFSFRVPGGEEANADLVRRIHADGFCLLSSSRVAGSYVIRFCVVNHRTTEDDVDRTVDRVLALIG